VEYGKSIYVPSFGWAVFGNLGNDWNKTQLLASLDADWKEGPALTSPLELADKQCMFKVNSFYMF
jgi:hypothetical protein